MKHFVAVHQWVDQGAAPLDPATMQFRAKLAEEGAGQCSSCVFRKQNWRVCVAAASLAVKSSQHDCDDRDDVTGRTYIYMLAVTDSRQQDFFAE